MENVFHLVLITVCMFLNGCGVSKELEPKKESKVETSVATEVETSGSDTDEGEETESAPGEEEAALREKMEDEVIDLWTMYLEDRDTSSKDSRWTDMHGLASSLVRYVRKYQTEGVMHMKEKVYLPEHENVHLLIATMVTFESALWPEVVGSMGEVGLLQVHGVALNGFKPEDVKRNPDLGLKLGIRWLTKQIPYCNVPRGDQWTDDDWLGPLSIYGGGVNRAKKNGKCLNFKVSKRRIEYTKLYRDRINSKYSV